jgi:hypothetical protein
MLRGGGGGCRHIGGQRELKCCTPFAISTSPQATSVTLDNPPTDGQSHAGTLGFGREEGLENPVDLSARKADARITH